MHSCPECYGEIEEMDDHLECIDCGAQFELGSTDEDYEEIEEEDRYED